MTNEDIVGAAERLCDEAGLAPEVKERIKKEVADSDTFTGSETHTFIVRRLKVDGKLNTDRHFSPGINLILGDNFAGKSTILDILKACLTGKKDAIDAEILPQLSIAYVECTLDDERFTVARDFVGRDSGVYAGGIDSVLAGQAEKVVARLSDLKSFWLDRLGYPPITKLQTKAGDVEKLTKVVGFGDYFRAFYQDQDRGYSELFSRESFETRQHVFNVMIGAANAPLSNRARIRYGQLQNQLAIDGHSINAFRQFLQVKVEKLSKISDIEKGLKALHVQATDAEHLWEAARRDLSAVTVQATDDDAENSRQLQAELMRLSARQAEAEGLRDEQERRLKAAKDRISALHAQEEAAVVLQSYYPVVCPRCIQSIPEEWAERESTDGECRICHRHAPEDEDAATTMRVALAEAEDEVKEIEAALVDSQATITALASQWETLNNKRKALVERQRGTLESVLGTAADYLVKSREEASRQTVISSEAAADSRYLADMIAAADADKKEIAVWQEIESLALRSEKSADFGNPYEVFSRNVAEFLDKLKKAHRGAPMLDPKGLLSIGGVPFEKLRAGEKARVCIAVFYSILAMAVRNQGRLPRFMIVDSPRQQEMDEDDYRTVGRQYAGLAAEAKKLGVEFQVIIASAAQEISDAAQEENIWRIPPGSHTLQPNVSMVAS